MMPIFSANLSMLFQEYPFKQRFEQAHLAGFTHIECLFPYSESIAFLQQELQQNKLHFSLFNAPAGNWENGERGFAAIEQYRERFEDSIEQALEYAVALGCQKIHVMAGSLDRDSDLTFSDKTFIENIRYAAKVFEPYCINVLIEPLNQRDNPNYYLSDFHKAVELLDQIQYENVKLQFDFYHAQIIHGDVTQLFERYCKQVGHIQIASVPFRHEPNSGELNDSYIFQLIEKKNYQGQIGCEYKPKTTTQAGLSWLNNYKHSYKGTL